MVLLLIFYGKAKHPTITMSFVFFCFIFKAVIQIRAQCFFWIFRKRANFRTDIKARMRKVHLRSLRESHFFEKNITPRKKETETNLVIQPFGFYVYFNVFEIRTFSNHLANMLNQITWEQICNKFVFPYFPYYKSKVL